MLVYPDHECGAFGIVLLHPDFFIIDAAFFKVKVCTAWFTVQDSESLGYGTGIIFQLTVYVYKLSIGVVNDGFSGLKSEQYGTTADKRFVVSVTAFRYFFTESFQKLFFASCPFDKRGYFKFHLLGNCISN